MKETTGEIKSNSGRGNPKPAYERLYNRKIKRCLDLGLSVIGLTMAIPLYLVIAVAIVSDTGFPVFYRPLRGGYQGKPFRICKFRTMVQDADKIGGGTTALNDSRITRVGHILRKTKLDETANLLNILSGTMSFIGPRPELLQYTDRYQGREKEILMVRPGVTDFSSLEFINLDEIVGPGNADEMYEKHVLKRKNRLRVRYAETVSFQTDAYLFAATLWKVLKKQLSLCCGGKGSRN